MKRIEELAGEREAHRAASMAQFIATNGGLGGYEDRDPELWDAIETRVRHQNEMREREEAVLAEATRQAVADHILGRQDRLRSVRATCLCGWAGEWAELPPTAGQGGEADAAVAAQHEAHRAEVEAAFAVTTDRYNRLRDHLYQVHGNDDAPAMSDLTALRCHELDHNKLDECRTGRPGVLRQHPRDWWGSTRRNRAERPLPHPQPATAGG